VGERKLELEIDRLQQALRRIEHYPVPRHPAATSPTIVIEILREALIQIRVIAREALCK